MHRPGLAAVITLTLALVPSVAGAATRSVGPGLPYTTPCQAIAAAAPGDTIQIDARGNGTYHGDVCRWDKPNLTIEGVNGRAHVDAAGKSSGGKGIWVVAGPNTVVRDVELTGAKVPDRNGAGIRVEGDGDLTLVRAVLRGNEDGILVTGSGETDVVVESSLFTDNGAGDGYSHNIYVARARSFIMRYSASRGTRRGHLVKTRAHVNEIVANRLTGEGSTSSYELDIPDGGAARVVGNVIQQGPATENSTLLAFAEESTSNPGSRLTLLHNTFVNDRPGPAIAVRVGGASLPVTGANNLAAGTMTWPVALPGTCAAADPQFTDRARHDVRLLPSSPCRDVGVTTAGDPPAEQYVYDLGHEPRPRDGRPDAGAFEVGTAPAGTAPAPPPPAAPGTVPPAPARLALLGRRLRADGRIAVRLRAPATGRVVASVRRPRGTYVRRSVRVTAGRATTIVLRPTRAGRRALARRKRPAFVLVLRLRPRAGGAALQRTITVRAPRR